MQCCFESLNRTALHSNCDRAKRPLVNSKAMQFQIQKVDTPIPAEMIDAIRAFPARREVEHCGTSFTLSPFDMYATCPQCGLRMKVRSFSGHDEIEDVFDAVFTWMADPDAQRFADERRERIAEELEEE